jgi:predicted amidohydrolase
LVCNKRICQTNILFLILALAMGGLNLLFPSTAGLDLPETRVLKVAMCQIFCLDGDRAGNLKRIEHAAHEAKTKGAEVACFPETSLLGWVNPDAHKRAFPIPGEDSDRLCALAREVQIVLCVGLAEATAEGLYDTVVLIDDRGTLLLKHRKINILTELMSPPYTPGRTIKAAETKYGRIGLMICADTFKKELLVRMNEERPDLVLVPYGWAAEEEEWPEHGENLQKTVAAAARIIGAPVVGTDLVGEISHGPWTGQVYGGQSVAADASGRVLGKAADRDREIKIIEVPLATPGNKRR